MERTDRLAHLKNEFYNRTEFEHHIVPAVKNSNGAHGLWQTIIQIISNAKEQDLDFVIICEDDHQFTKNYNPAALQQYILTAAAKNADILLGGVSWYRTAFQVTEQLFNVEKFSGLQFSIIYKRFYDKILNADSSTVQAADFKIAELSNNKLVIFPFISTQKEFGYSDVTAKNNKKGYVTSIFKKTAAMLQQVEKVTKFYASFPAVQVRLTADQCNEIVLPTYVINISDQLAQLDQVKKEFVGKNEFELHLIENTTTATRKNLFWSGLVKAIHTAITNDDDVIVICTTAHVFSASYSKQLLLNNIIEANEQGVGLLFMNAIGIGQLVPLTKERYWFNTLGGSTFFIVYKKVFDQILSYQFTAKDEVFKVLSMLTSHKMLIDAPKPTIDE